MMTNVTWEMRASFGWPPMNKQGVNHCTPDDGTAVHYDGSDQRLAAKGHAACRLYWRGTRAFHMADLPHGRGWNDIGYAWGVCPHGAIFEGRGWGWTQAAQPGGNTTWESCTFMSGPGELPTRAQMEAWFALREWLVTEKGVGAGIRPHSSFIETDCPGPILTGMIKDGSLKTITHTNWTDMVVRELPELSVGNVNFDVKTARGLLFQRGWKKGLTPEQVVEWLSKTEFDAEFRDDVMRYQASKRLVVDGIVGLLTWTALVRG